MRSKVVVKRNETDPEPVEVIAQAILDISSTMKRINSSRLSRRALIALIHDESKVAKRTIEVVLNNLDQLERIWLKQPGTKK